MIFFCGLIPKAVQSKNSYFYHQILENKPQKSNLLREVFLFSFPWDQSQSYDLLTS